jgi:hypothetical protein
VPKAKSPSQEPKPRAGKEIHEERIDELEFDLLQSAANQDWVPLGSSRGAFGRGSMCPGIDPRAVQRGSRDPTDKGVYL